MISLNIPSLVDFLALLLTGHVLFVFCYDYWRVRRRHVDLIFAIILVLVFIHCVLMLAADNVVPAGVSAWKVPDAAAKTLFLCQVMWVNGMFVLATAMLFVLHYTRSSFLPGWHGAWIYVIAALVALLCTTEHFVVLRPSPACEFVSWTCVAPWLPLPGVFSWAPVAVWLGTSLMIVSLVIRYFRQEPVGHSQRVRSRLVLFGVIFWAIGGAVDTVLAIQNYFGISPSTLAMAISMLLVGVGLAEEHAQTEREREHVTRRFQSYVDPALVKYVIEHPETRHIDGEVRELTVVFTDLEGFTNITERLREGAVELLNEYLRLMTPLIRNHNGCRNKFLGDGMMFFYGAPEWNPDHAIHAVSTVLKMQEMMVKLNETMTLRRKHLCDGLPQLKMRTGVSTGQMIVGDAGPEDASDYTVLGDTVNLGSRLETANKAMGTHILLSERTVELLPADLFLLRPIGRLQVVGLSRPVMTYEPLAYLKDATDLQMTTAELTRGVVERFLLADFEGCSQAVERFEAELGATKFSALYRNECQRYRSAPPASNFGGYLILLEK